MKVCVTGRNQPREEQGRGVVGGGRCRGKGPEVRESACGRGRASGGGGTEQGVGFTKKAEAVLSGPRLCIVSLPEEGTPEHQSAPGQGLAPAELSWPAGLGGRLLLGLIPGPSWIQGWV